MVGEEEGTLLEGWLADALVVVAWLEVDAAAAEVALCCDTVVVVVVVVVLGASAST